ncbi:MAG: TolC family protein, partial [Campylobacteraceae bacterium]|nr:TolC family protein [Campylobacteraceae bacterium]
TKYHDIDNQDNRFKDGDKYGFNITVPFYFSTFNDIEKEKINIKLSKLELENSITKENNLYKTSLSKLKSLDAKIDLAKEDYEIYDSLLKIIIEEKDAQIKTQEDVDTLKNSQTIRALDIKMFNFDKQIILLDLYSKIN